MRKRRLEGRIRKVNRTRWRGLTCEAYGSHPGRAASEHHEELQGLVMPTQSTVILSQESIAVTANSGGREIAEGAERPG